MENRLKSEALQDLSKPMDAVPFAREKMEAIRHILDAIEKTCEESGPMGAPGGVLYLALSTQGCTLAAFESLMGILLRAGRVRRDGECYVAVKGGAR